MNFAILITLSRACASFFVVYFLLQQMWWSATIIFLFAALSDLLDGYVARRFGYQTKIGQILDPIADKILLTLTMFTLLAVIPLNYSAQAAVYFLIIKELVILTGGAYLYFIKHYFIVPSILSRAVGLAECMLVLFLLARLTIFASMPDAVGVAMFALLLGINVCLSVWLLVRYLFVFLDYKK